MRPSAFWHLLSSVPKDLIPIICFTITWPNTFKPLQQHNLSCAGFELESQLIDLTHFEGLDAFTVALHMQNLLQTHHTIILPTTTDLSPTSLAPVTSNQHPKAWKAAGNISCLQHHPGPLTFVATYCLCTLCKISFSCPCLPRQ